MEKISGLFAEERKEEIQKMVETSGRISVPELAKHFGVSGTTIRNDLRDMEKDKLIIRTHGGAISNRKNSAEDWPDARENESSKMKIAKKALDYIEDGDCILIDTGTTSQIFAQLLAEKSVKNLRVVTNDLIIAETLESAEQVETILIGGTIRKHFHYTFGAQVIRQIEQFTVDKSFICTTAFSPKHGFSTPNLWTAEAKEAMIRAAGQVIMLCDSSKFETTSFKIFAKPKDIDLLLTDDSTSPGQKSQLTELGLAFVIAQ